jgi:hypothetical protein
MAKVKGPLFSEKATGGMGIFTYGNYQGIGFCKLKTHKRDVKSDKQMQNRQLYREAVIVWQGLTVSEKEEYNQEAAGCNYSGNNLLVKEYIGANGFGKEGFGKYLFGRG